MCSGPCSSSGSRALVGQWWWAERVAGQTEAQLSPLVLLGKDRSRLEKGAEEGTGCLGNLSPCSPFLCFLSTKHLRTPRPGNP